MEIISLIDFRNSKIAGNFREFEDYYEYCFIKEYEEKYESPEINSIQIGDVHVVTLEEKNKFLIAGILFFKDMFSLEKSINWITKHNAMYIEDTEATVKGALKIIEGIKFKGRAIIIYKKGSSSIKINTSVLKEITSDYNCTQVMVDTTKSKNASFEKQLIIYVNGEKTNDIPRIDFIRSRDFVIANGVLLDIDYIGEYKNSLIGFFTRGNPNNPIAIVPEDNTEVFIEIYTREDGAVICYMDYKYVIDPYQLTK